MEILTREELKELKEYLDKTHGEKAVTNMQDVTNTALALYDENEKMKAGIEKLKNMYVDFCREIKSEHNACKFIDPEVTAETTKEIQLCEKIVSDLAALCGKEDK